MSESPVRVLKDLSVQAMLGTSRAGPSGASAESFLTLAAVSGARARAGRRHRETADAVEVCPKDDRAVANAAQSALLERLLSSPDGALIREWCVLALARSVRPPSIAVPRILEWWSKQSQRMPEVFEATGVCGVWLSKLNDEWQKPVEASAIPDDADSQWQTASSAERSALLLTVRKKDPSRALDMVKATWSVDGADERRRFLEVLGQGVSSADESFLEAALDDRSKLVRREAARVLKRLPGSALRARMTQRAQTLVAVEKRKAGLLRGSKMTVTIEPPKDFDKAWERDGVEEQVSGGRGKRAFWLEQLIAGADLQSIVEVSGLSPTEFLDSIGKDEFFNDVLLGVIASVAGCPEQAGASAWGDALVPAFLSRKQSSMDSLTQVWCALRVEHSEAMRLRAARIAKFARASMVWDVLASDPRAWSLEFSSHAMEMMRKSVPKKADSWEFWEPVERVSKLLHLGAAQQFEELLISMYPDGLSDSIRKSAERVRIRAELHKEFQS